MKLQYQLLEEQVINPAPRESTNRLLTRRRLFLYSIVTKVVLCWAGRNWSSQPPPALRLLLAVTFNPRGRREAGGEVTDLRVSTRTVRL
jgi:hypothetical protein